jgi:hypothetical protein
MFKNKAEPQPARPFAPEAAPQQPSGYNFASSKDSQTGLDEQLLAQ